ncbi:MAG: iron-containing redox enzyme family protein [Bdellovibrionales bacterium]
MKTFSSEEWKKIYEKNLSQLMKSCDEFPWHLKEAYAAWLVQTFHLVKHTTRFIALTSARMPFERNDIHYDLVNHFREEKGHDRMAADDLKNIGYETTDFPELPETQAIVRSQYYAIDYLHPFAHFGYSFCFEGLAVKKAGDISKAVNKHLKAKNCTTFLDLHAEVDVAHFTHAFEILKNIGWEETQQIVANLELSCSLYESLLTRLKQQALKGQLKQVA